MAQQLRTGIDVIEIVRIQRAVDRWGERFLRRTFTDRELADCGAAGSDSPPWRYGSLAARWAAKEATAKAFGVGFRGLGAGGEPLGVTLLEIEVVRGPLRRPLLHLHGRAAQLAEQLGLRDLALSMSHARDYAVASVVGLCGL